MHGTHPLYTKIAKLQKELNDVRCSLNIEEVEANEALKFKVVLEKVYIDLSCQENGVLLLCLHFTLLNRAEVLDCEQEFGKQLRKNFNMSFLFRKIHEDYVILTDGSRIELKELMVITVQEFNALLTEKVLPSEINHYLSTFENYMVSQ